MWGWIALLVGSGLAWAHFSASAQAATDLIHAAVAAALSKETDPDVLTVFAQKLRSAGYDQEAAEINARAHVLYGIRAVTVPNNILRNIHL